MPKDIAKLNKEIRREALREELQAREYIRQLGEIDQTIAENWKNLTAPQVGALKLRAELQFKRLDKVLPDLKAVEVEGTLDNVHRVVSGAPMEENEWEQRYADSLEPPGGTTESTH